MTLWKSYGYNTLDYFIPNGAYFNVDINNKYKESYITFEIKERSQCKYQ